VGGVQHHHVIEALPAQGADEVLHVRILSRRPWRDRDLVHPQGLNSA
jgi:hypothetical protein